MQRRRFPVGANPTRQSLQPEAIGAVMEVTKWLKTRKNKFMVKRKTQAKRLARKLKAIREEMKHRMHAPLSAYILA